MTYALKARVHDGRLVMNEPVDLPEGTEVELVPAPEDDTLDEENRARLHAALGRSSAQFQTGQGILANDVLMALETRNSGK